jgi:hypothetical protein
MAITGKDFDELWQQRIDKAYNSYLGALQRQALYKRAVYYTVENIYNQLRFGGEYDEIRSLIKTDFPVVPINNAIPIPTSLADYAHYLYATGEFFTDTYEASGFFFEAGGTLTMLFSGITKLRTGTYVSISNQNEIPEANGRFYLKRTGRITYELYLDKDLEQKVTTSIFSGSTATVKQIIVSGFTMQFSDQRIGELIKPTKESPKIQIADNSLKIEPTGCQRVLIDYVTIPPIDIDPQDTTIDLELTYTTKLIYQFLEKAAELFAVQTKDAQSFQEAVQTQNLNP